MRVSDRKTLEARITKTLFALAEIHSISGGEEQVRRNIMA